MVLICVRYTGYVLVCDVLVRYLCQLCWLDSCVSCAGYIRHVCKLFPILTTHFVLVVLRKILAK
jgi:hypothetical protein